MWKDALMLGLRHAKVMRAVIIFPYQPVTPIRAACQEYLRALDRLYQGYDKVT